MFYCESCRQKNGWQDSFRLSHGPCEICQKTKYCYDMPSDQLSRQRKSKKVVEKGANTVIKRLRLLETDHKPDGYPAVKMSDITALLDSHDRLENVIRKFLEVIDRHGEMIDGRLYYIGHCVPELEACAVEANIAFARMEEK